MKNKIKFTIKCIIMLFTGLLCNGCSTVGNVFIPKHPQSSLGGDNNIMTLSVIDKSKESKFNSIETKTFIEAPLATAAIGFMLDEVVKGIEKESKRYSATYSARAKTIVTYNSDVDSTNSVIRLEGPKQSELVISRGAALVFRANIYWSTDSLTFYIQPTSFSFKGAGSKVASSGWPSSTIMPWRWPALIVFGSMELFGYEKYFKTDVNVQLQFDGIIRGKSINIGTVDFPMGKLILGSEYSLDPCHVGYNKLKLEALQSPYMGIPLVLPKGNSKIVIPLNITATVIEANDLGDVIGKGAVKANDKKDDAEKAILDKLGITDE